MEVTPVVKKQVVDKKANKIPDPLPKGDTRVLFVAPSNTGKTNTLVWLLKQPTIYDYYGLENIYLFSPTAIKLDETWKQVKLALQNVHEEFNIMRLLEIAQYYEEINTIRQEEKKDKIKFLIILDDCVDLLKSWDDNLKGLIFRLRHYGGSIWITSQSYKSVPKCIRLNTTHRLFFSMNNSDIEDVAKEVKLPSKLFKKIYDYATNSDENETWHFLYINDKKNMKNGMYKDFMKQIVIPDEVINRYK